MFRSLLPEPAWGGSVAPAMKSARAFRRGISARLSDLPGAGKARC